MTLKTKAVDVEAIGAQLPNLDDCGATYEEFMDAANALGEVGAVCMQLKNYAEARGIAHWARMQGHIARAEQLEAHMQTVYDKLPDWAKW